MVTTSWAIVVHGGAGVIERAHLTAEQDKAYRDAMARTAETGAAVLKAGGSALDAVEAAVRLMEDDPLFNAGRGSVFSAEGRIEMDAAIMDGATLAAGAVAGVTATRHPISLARAVMEQSPHVMLVGEGADAFSRDRNLVQVEPGYFATERRWKSLVKDLNRLNLTIPPRPASLEGDQEPRAELAHHEGKHGTVGVVALDNQGHVAAATSTGGTSAKRWGRVGDSPVIGAGTYASDRACAVSGTGTGEYFIRTAAGRTIAALVEYKGLNLQAAVDQLIHGELEALGGDGGVIAVAPDGQMAWAFNTPGMYRARMSASSPLTVGIYGDDP